MTFLSSVFFFLLFFALRLPLFAQGSCICPIGAPEKMYGNANCDTKIDLVDFQQWLNNYLKNFSGETPAIERADFNCDTKVDLVDFNLWLKGYQKNFETEPVGSGNIIFVFADGNKSDYTVAYPILSGKGMRAVSYVNPSTIGTRGAKMTVDDLLKLNNAGWDIASHGYRHENPVSYTPEQLEEDLRMSSQWLVDNGFNQGGRHYGPPLNCNQAVIDTAGKYFQTIRGDATDCRLMPSGYEYLPDSSGDDRIPWETLKTKIDAVTRSNQVMMIVFHRVGDASTGTSLERFNQVVDYVIQKGLSVKTLSDLLDGS